MSDDQLLRAFDAPCRQLGLELDDVELRAGVLHVTVDRPGGGLDLDLLAGLSKQLSTLLDEHDELAPTGRYELEVSSPGLERRLRRPEQFRRAVGNRVGIRTQAGTEGDRRLEGLLVSADEDVIVVRLDDGRERTLAYRELERARTVFDWQGELAARRAAEKGEKAEKVPRVAGQPRAGGAARSSPSGSAGGRAVGDEPVADGQDNVGTTGRRGERNEKERV